MDTLKGLQVYPLHGPVGNWNNSMDSLQIPIDMGVSKYRGTPKWVVYKFYNEKPYEQMDDLGGFPPILGNPHMNQRETNSTICEACPRTMHWFQTRMGYKNISILTNYNTLMIHLSKLKFTTLDFREISWHLLSRYLKLSCCGEVVWRGFVALGSWKWNMTAINILDGSIQPKTPWL